MCCLHGNETTPTIPRWEPLSSRRRSPRWCDGRSRVGIDVVSDGEMSKISYATYIAKRFSGFAGDTPREPGQDLVEFPGLLTKLAERGSTAKYRRPRCVGEGQLRNDSARFRRTCRICAPRPMQPPPSRSIHECGLPGRHRTVSTERLLPRLRMTIWRRSRKRCAASTRQLLRPGVILQIDAPDLAMGRHTMYRNRSLEEFDVLAAQHIEVLNHALRNVPADRVRMHVCWGNYEGPHHHDVPMERLLPIVLKAKPQGLLFEAANPRHAHEWIVFRDAKIPDDKILIPGVLATTTNYIEHPLLGCRATRNLRRASSDAIGSLQVPIAGSEPSPDSVRWNRTSCT